jgi:glutathione peroxidase
MKTAILILLFPFITWAQGVGSGPTAQGTPMDTKAPPEQSQNAGAVKKASAVTAFSVKTIDGGLKNLADYKGHVLLIVNVASRCGFTPQYKALEAVYEKYKDKGLVVLGFPSNDFGGQEPGSNQEIKKFCSLKYNVTFPMFEKNPVTGADKQPLYRYLTEQTDPAFHGEVKWNFEKFLVNRKGQVVDRFLSTVKPDSVTIDKKIQDLLTQ